MDAGKSAKTGNARAVLKRILPHLLLLIAASLYTVGGGYAFYLMERHFRHNQPPHTVQPTSSDLVDTRSVRSVECSPDLQWGLAEAARRECVVLAANDSRPSEDSARYCATLLNRLSQCLRPSSKEESIDFKSPNDSHVRETATLSNGFHATIQKRVNEFDSRIRSGEWTPSTCTFLAFTVITTIGYGDIAPVTTWGRLFCIIYGLVGIPLALLAIADQGRFITEFVLVLYRRSKRLANKYRIKTPKDHSLPVKPASEDESDTMPAFLLLTFFGLYLVLGGYIFTFYEPHWSFMDAVYFLFISSSTVGFGDLLPSSGTWLPLTLLYIALGLALATIAIDIFAEYLRRLHHFGAKLRNCANKLVYFGGRRFTIAELVRVVGIQLGVSEEKIENLVENFDTVIEKTMQDNGVSEQVKEEPVDCDEGKGTFCHPSLIPFIDSPCESDAKMSIWSNAE